MKLRSLFFFLVFGLSTAISTSTFAAESEKEIAPKTRHLGISFRPLDYLIGSYNLRFEVPISKKIALTLPVFYANHDSALIKGSLFWKSSLGYAFGVKFFPVSSALDSGLYLTAETGIFVIYPFEKGTRHLFGGNSVYSEVEKSPAWIVMNSFRIGYQWVHDTGFFLDCSAGVVLYAVIPNPDLSVSIGWAF